MSKWITLHVNVSRLLCVVCCLTLLWQVTQINLRSVYFCVLKLVFIIIDPFYTCVTTLCVVLINKDKALYKYCIWIFLLLLCGWRYWYTSELLENLKKCFLCISWMAICLTSSNFRQRNSEIPVAKGSTKHGRGVQLELM